MELEKPLPGYGEESVWDYPRPPRLEKCSKHIIVRYNGITIADTREAKRVLETSHPPVFYIPLEDIATEYLVREKGSSWCEWKGKACYYSVVVGERRAFRAAWYYPAPVPAFVAIRNSVAFYPGLMDVCLVDGVKVKPQPGGFYGGWITPDIRGPFKGEPGTALW
jgi:uncharacterized protein (DUF427 family)